MRTEYDPSGQELPRTFIEAARRAQIVAAAIETIAAVGYSQASLARIAERAGISKGVIGYHFAGKDDLLREVVAEVLARAEEFMVPLIRANSAEVGLVRAYVESNRLTSFRWKARRPATVLGPPALCSATRAR